MYIQVAGAIVNMVLDPIMIFGMGMGLTGAAWATVVSFVVSCIIAFMWYLRGKTFVTLKRTVPLMDRARQRVILSVGLPEAIELSIFHAFNIVLNFLVVECGGTDAMAVYMMAWRIGSFLMIPGQAFGGALVPVCSAKYGMGRFDLIRDAFRYASVYAFLSTTVLSVVTVLFSGVFTDVFIRSDDLMHMKGEMVALLCCISASQPFMASVFMDHRSCSRSAMRTVPC